MRKGALPQSAGVENSCPGGVDAPSKIKSIEGVESLEEPLRVDPEELGMAAGQLEGQAGSFATDHEAAHAKAAGVTLGSASGAALAGMLSAWESERVQFGAAFTGHADAHREAAGRYVQGDDGGAAAIDGAASSM